jgi:hypothetical protein
MTIEKRLQQAKLAEQQKTAAAHIAQDRANEKRLADEKQRWIEFRSLFQQQFAILQQYLESSGLSSLLQEAKNYLKADIIYATSLRLTMSKGIPIDHKFRWPLEWDIGNFILIDDATSSKLSMGDDDPSHRLSERDISVLSRQTRIFQLRWDINRKAELPGKIYNCSHISGSITTEGTINIFGEQSYSIPQATWVTNPSFLEENITSAILQPMKYQYYPARVPQGMGG